MADLNNIFPGGFVAKLAPSMDLADPVRAFTDECMKYGLDVTRGVIPDGEIHRVPHESSKRGAVDGWYVVHIDGRVPVGRIGCFKEPSFEVEWQANIGRELSFVERMEHKKWLDELRERLAREKAAAQEAAAEKAEYSPKTPKAMKVAAEKSEGGPSDAVKRVSAKKAALKKKACQATRHQD